jgi:uncharacterized protein
MEEYRLSRFSIPFIKDNTYLIYCSSKSNFYELNKESFEYVCSLNSSDINNDSLKQLHDLGIISTESEDQLVYNKIKLNYLTSAYSNNLVTLTIAPTLSCNLRCPYCFESNKPSGVMDKKTCDALMSFIRQHKFAKYLSVTWYGGEPLLGSKSIAYLIPKIKKLKKIKLVRHSMVTNGVLLKGDNLKLFEELPLNDIQITLDGNKGTHNQKRIRTNGEGTFDEILTNMEAFANKYPLTNMSVRVNIDKNNSNEFMDVYEMVHKMFPDKKNIFVYPGILRGCMSSMDSPFLLNKDIIKVNEDFYKRGLPFSYPHNEVLGCSATAMCGYVIGPNGEIYKCWMDVGMPEMVVGNVKDKKYTNIDLLCKYMLSGINIDDEKCKNCKILPICSGGCPKNRMENKCFDGDYELCSIYKENDFEALTDLLYKIYIYKFKDKPSENSKDKEV